MVAVAAGVAATLTLGGCGLSLQSLPQIGGSGGGGYTIHAVFSTVASLAPNAKVRDGDAVVGRVSAIHARNFQAVVDMSIQKGLVLPVGTTAEARFSTPLGDEYIALTVPSGPLASRSRLAPGATLDEAQTHAAPTVADTLAALATVLYGSGLGQAKTITTELNQILGGRGPEFQKLLSDVNVTVTSLAGNDSGIDTALASLGKISAQLNGGTGSLVAALDTLPQAAQTIDANNTALAQLLTSINQLTPATLAVISHSGANLVQDSRQLAPVAAQLATIQGQVGTDLADLQRVIADVGKTAPAGYVQGDFSFDTTYPGVGCVPHIGVNLAACNPLYPSSNVAPESKLEADPATPNSPPASGGSSTSAASTSAASSGQAAGAVTEMEAALP